MFCAHMYSIFLRGEGSITFINAVGWTFISASAFNILGNLSIVVFETIKDAGEKIVNYRDERQRIKAIKERKENRDVIVKSVPGKVRVFEFENKLHEVIA